MIYGASRLASFEFVFGTLKLNTLYSSFELSYVDGILVTSQERLVRARIPNLKPKL